MHPLNERVRRGRRLVGHLQDDELVAADAGDHSRTVEPAAQTLRDPLQQGVADGRPELSLTSLNRSISNTSTTSETALERVAVEHLLHALAQLHAVR